MSVYVGSEYLESLLSDSESDTVYTVATTSEC